MIASSKINSLARMEPLGDTALVLAFGDQVDRAISARVIAARDAVAAAGLEGIVDLVPTFCSLAVHFAPEQIGAADLAARIGMLDLAEPAIGAQGRAVRIPVLYDGPDLDAVAQAAGLSPGEVAKLHAATPYHVYMLGFLPGFAYLGDLPDSLRLPRLKEPRTRVPPGSVALAGQMTAVYPVQSPGGWHLIGRTPLILFDHRKDSPSLLQPGDEVRFEAIGKAEFGRLSSGIEPW